MRGFRHFVLWGTLMLAGCQPTPDPGPPPAAAFSFAPNANLVAPATVSFRNESRHATAYRWDFGDGQSSTEAAPTHAYKTAGTYTVALTATNDAGSNQAQATLTVAAAPVSLPSVDKAVADFMAKYDLPGVSIALVKDDRLVYAKAYGLADKATNTALRPDHVFRLASISKSITGLAVFKLIEDGKLNLDAKVFGPGALLGTEYGTLLYGPHVGAITVRHLLQHTAGGWNNRQNDPLFFPDWLGQSQNQLISTVLDTRPLVNPPGTAYDYSNFGYLLLGRIIEKASGQTYRDYVREKLLLPAGITAMDLAGDTQAERLPNEVTYYDVGFSPYAMKVRRMDANGGWAASAPDLARLLVRVNGFPGKPDLLRPTSISQMTTPSAVYANYACGWSVNALGNWWHQGSLPGTSTMWARLSNGTGWVILVNQRSNADAYTSDLDALMWNAVAGIAQWPTQDLF